MITQGFLDFIRNTLLNWFSGLSTLAGPDQWQEVGAAIRGGTSGVGSFLSLLFTNSGWGWVLGTYGLFLTVWLGSSLVAIVGRRMASK